MMNKTKNFFSGVANSVSGFTMVELVIIVVVIGLSSAIAVPIVTSNDTKAKLSEADATLSSLRTQLRIYYSKNGEYPVAPEATEVIGAIWNEFATGHLDGKYFSDASYSYVCESGTEFTLVCEAGSILNTDRTINQSGVIRGGI